LALRLLFIVDPLESLKAYKDSSVAMMRAAQLRGHEVWAAEPSHLRWSKGRASAQATRLSLADNDEDWYRPHENEARALADFSAIVMRKDPPFDLEYVSTTWLLSAAEREGARVFNSPQAIRDHNEKLAIAEFPAFTVPSLATRDMGEIQAFIDEHKHTVVKRLDGMGGSGMFIVRHDDPNRNALVETVSAFGERSVMAQRYIPEIRDGDHRVLLIDGRAVPHSLARIPKAGESRGNLAAGAQGVARPLNPRQKSIAEALGPVLAKRGLLLVGLDVIGDWLTEINVTSPTCFREIQDQTGFDVAGMFLGALESKLK
jgi:glutathione synthase